MYASTGFRKSQVKRRLNMLKSRSSVAKLRHLIYKSLELNEKVADKYVQNADINTAHAGTQRADKLIVLQKENHKAAIS